MEETEMLNSKDDWDDHNNGSNSWLDKCRQLFSKKATFPNVVDNSYHNSQLTAAGSWVRLVRVRQTVSDDEQDGDSRDDLEDLDNELYCGEYRLPELRIEIKDDKASQIPIT